MVSTSHPATAVSRGTLSFTGAMTLTGSAPLGVPTAPSLSPTPVGSGEEYPVSGGNETCGKNNPESLTGTHVPDPLVDEIGVCEDGTSGLYPGFPGGSGGWTMDITDVPPDVCRGGGSRDVYIYGQVCTVESNGGWSGTCSLNFGSGGMMVTFSGPLGPMQIPMYVSWSASGTVAMVTGTAYDPYYGSSAAVMGTFTFVSDTPCSTSTTRNVTVVGELSWSTV